MQMLEVMPQRGPFRYLYAFAMHFSIRPESPECEFVRIAISSIRHRVYDFDCIARRIPTYSLRAQRTRLNHSAILLPDFTEFMINLIINIANMRYIVIAWHIFFFCLPRIQVAAAN